MGSPLYIFFAMGMFFLFFFRSFFLCFSLKCPFPINIPSLSGNTIYMRLLLIRDSIRVELFYFDDNFRRIALWVSAFSPQFCSNLCRNDVASQGSIRKEYVIHLNTPLILTIISATLHCTLTSSIFPQLSRFEIPKCSSREALFP